MALTLSRKAAMVKPSTTLAITAKAKAMKAEGVDVVGFAGGEPDVNTPDNINQAAIQAIHDGFTKYTPASGIQELREAISKKFKEFNQINYKPNQIVISSGGKHSLANIFQAIINPGDEVIIPVPYWLSYPEIVKLCDGVPVYVHGKKENGYKVTAEEIEAAITDKTKAFILNSPNNPTGMIYTEQELLAIAEVVVKHDIYVVADEIYERLTFGDKKHVSIASLNDEIYKRTITCSGLAKSYSMTGWRVGYTGSSVEIAKLMGSVQSHQTANANSIAQKAAIEAILGPQDAVEQMRQEFERRMKYIHKRVVELPLIDAMEPEGTFYLFVDLTEVVKQSYKGKQIKTAARAAEILLEDYQVTVVPCADFGFDNFIRISYATSMEMIEEGMDRFEKFLISIT